MSILVSGFTRERALTRMDVAPLVIVSVIALTMLVRVVVSARRDRGSITSTQARRPRKGSDRQPRTKRDPVRPPVGSMFGPYALHCYATKK